MSSAAIDLHQSRDALSHARSSADGNANGIVMRSDAEALPIEGPASNPVLYGVARGLADLLPPIELRTCHSDENETSVSSLRQQEEFSASEEAATERSQTKRPA